MDPTYLDGSYLDGIYLDYNATTPLHPKVREAMLEVLSGVPGNPSSLHSFGRAARRIVEVARERVGTFLGVDPLSLYFTSGGTESNNLVILGIEDRDRPIWISAGEHPTVREPARRRWQCGANQGRTQQAPGGELPLTTGGQTAIDDELPALDGALVSMHWVNNETGVRQPISQWSRRVHEQGGILHSDGAQGFFRIPTTIPELGIDLATVTAHKSFGPLGVGVLYMRRGLVLDPLLFGGPQERKVRPGTENLAAIHGLGVLAEIATGEPLWPLEQLETKWKTFRSRLAEVPGAELVTPEQDVFPNTVNLTLDDLDAETLLVRLDMAGVAASSGSACSSGAREPSRILRAMGVPDHRIRSALRFSFGPSTGEDELLTAADRLDRIVEELHSRRR